MEKARAMRKADWQLFGRGAESKSQWQRRKKGFVSSQNYFADHQTEAKRFIQQRLLLTVHFVFGQRDRAFRRRVIDVALTFKLSGL
jgi:hypothetical protein